MAKAREIRDVSVRQSEPRTPCLRSRARKPLGRHRNWAASKSITAPLPSVVFVVALVRPLDGRSRPFGPKPPDQHRLRGLDGPGAALTVGYAVTFGDESATVVKVALIAGIVAAVIGLKVVGSSPSRRHRRG